jgi:predicted PurR-regulated permease PerM
MDGRFTKNAVQLAFATLLAIGCLLVLRPFLPGMLLACAIVISSWPLYQKLLARLHGRPSIAALCMTLGLALLVILPIALVAYSLTDDVARVYSTLRDVIATGTITLPAWIVQLPLVGAPLDTYLRELVGSREQMMELAGGMLEPARHYLLGGGLALGAGIAQMGLAAFVAFFLYRDGAQLTAALATGMARVIGDGAAKVGEIVSQTVRGVMYGMLGTALAQAVVAAIGFAIAGVPGVPLLGVATFLLSLVPVGPPVVWAGASIWLFQHGRPGWAAFMLVWGLVLISGVDNVVKPLLIARGSSLPFALVLLGVLGGVLAFGFVGLFIGPVLLAVGYSLLRDFTGGGAERPS